MTRTKQPIYRASLTADEIKPAIKKIERRIAALEEFDPSSVSQESAWTTSKTLGNSVKETLSQVFGENSSEYARYQSAANFGYTMIMGGTPPSRLLKNSQMA
jgi:hypothetical protein